MRKFQNDKRDERARTTDRKKEGERAKKKETECVRTWNTQDALCVGCTPENISIISLI